MSIDTDGGPAFPGGVLPENYVDAGLPVNDGMSLRDYFAAKAMQGLMVGDDGVVYEIFAEIAYKMADAMLVARGIQADVDSALAVNALRVAMNKDEEFAWTWHCNIAIHFIDEGGSHQAANQAAARFMSMAFEVDVTKFSAWKTFEEIWANEQTNKPSNA